MEDESGLSKNKYKYKKPSIWCYKHLEAFPVDLSVPSSARYCFLLYLKGLFSNFALIGVSLHPCLGLYTELLAPISWL